MSLYDLKSDPWAFLDEPVDVVSPGSSTEQNGDYQSSNNNVRGNSQVSTEGPAVQHNNVQLATAPMVPAQLATVQMTHAQSCTGQVTHAQHGTEQITLVQSGTGQMAHEAPDFEHMIQEQTNEGQMTTTGLQDLRDFIKSVEKVDELPPPELFQPSSPPPAAPAEGSCSVMAPNPSMAKQTIPAIVVHSDGESNLVSMSESVGQPMMLPQAVGLPVSNSQPLNTFQIINSGNGNNVAVPLQFTTAQIQPSTQMQMAQQALSGSVSHKVGGGVVDVPALSDMEGEYGFSVTIEEKERTTKSPMWLMSKITKKLYTNLNKAVPFEIHLKKRVPRDQFRVRAVAVFSSAQFLRTNVSRCPNHASTADITNHDFPYPAHVVRADHPEAQYDESPNGRLSVVVPLDILQDGSDYTPILLRFMCLGSCVGGINRRPIAIILTLENISGQIYGRKVIDVRVCACPTRDIRTDEMNRGVKRRGSMVQEKPIAPARKKPKSIEPKTEPQEDNKTYYIPVQGRHMYKFVMKMIGVYYETHPDYAAKYPMDTSFQIEDDSEDELKGNALQGLSVGDSETVNWDSGGNYSQHVTFNDEAHLDIMNGTKNNSPLSKLTPNISISPSSDQLRLWHDDVDNEMIGCSREDIVEYQHAAKVNDIIVSNSKSNNTSTIIDSYPLTKLAINQSQVVKNIDNLPKHIPVMQVQSYKPGSLSVKTKPMTVLKHNFHQSNGVEKGKKINIKKNARESVKQLSFDPSEILHEQNASEEYLSPGSPEMLAANVLVGGFKTKTITKQ